MNREFEPHRENPGGPETGSQAQPSSPGNLASGTSENELTRKARESGEKMKAQAQAAGSAQKERAAEKVESLGSAVRQASEKLKEQHNDTVAHYVEDVASRLESASHYIRDRDFSGLKEDAEDLARRQPELFLGGMFFAGLALGRVLKSSQSKPRSQRLRSRESEEEMHASEGAMTSLPAASVGAIPQHEENYDHPVL